MVAMEASMVETLGRLGFDPPDWSFWVPLGDENTMKIKLRLADGCKVKAGFHMFATINNVHLGLAWAITYTTLQCTASTSAIDRHGSSEVVERSNEPWILETHV